MTDVLAGCVTLHGPDGERPAADVAVSNGRATVRTDAAGRFTVPVAGAGRFLFLTPPSGWKTAGAWYHDRERRPDGPWDFALVAAPERAAQPFTFAQITDLHVSVDHDELPRMLQDQIAFYNEQDELVLLPLTTERMLVEDLHAVYDAAPVDLFIATGDVTNNGRAAEFAAYCEAISASPAPVMTIPGNHDYMVKKVGPKNYHNALGPSYYSFDWGGVHFLVWDWEGWYRWGEGYAQHEWVANDLAALPEGMPVIVLTHDHMPGEFYDRFPETNFLASFSGHWHTSRVFNDGRMVHYNTPTFCFGGMDYTPRAYRRVTVAENTIRVTTETLANDPALAGTTFRSTQAASIGPHPEAAAVEPGAAWPMQGGDVRRTGRADGNLDLPLALAWRVPVNGALCIGSPVIADDRVFIGTQDEDVVGGGVIALDVRTGAHLWTAPFGSSVKNTPAVANGVVVAMGVAGELAALDARTGDRRWTTQVGDPHLGWHYRPPLIVGGRIFTGDVRHFGAFDLATGKLLWELTDLWDPKEPPSYPITSPAAWTEGGVVFGNLYEPRHLFCVDPETGAIQWSADGGRDRSICAGPAVADDGALVVARLYAQVHVLESDGTKRWGHQWDSLFSPAAPAVGPDAVYAASGAGTFFKLDLATGEPQWLWQCGDALLSTAAYVRGGRSLVSSPVLVGDAVLVGGGDGKFRALAAADGSVGWEADLGAPVQSAAAVSGNAVVIGVSDGTVACFTPARA